MPDDHFSKLAPAYARGRPGYPSELFDALTQLCRERDLAWDCATGTGQAVPDLACRFGRVVATDISNELLRHAPAFRNVSYVAAPAERSPFPDSAVDLCTVAQALHWFDLPEFWKEVARVLKPGGVVAFWGYTWPTVDRQIDAILDNFRSVISPYWPERSILLHDEYCDVIAPFTHVQVPPFVMSASWTSADYVAHVASWSAVRYYCERTKSDLLPHLENRISEVWPGGAVRRVSWPLHLQVWRR